MAPPSRHIGKRLISRAGERLAFLTEQANEHDERFHARGRFFKVKALTVAVSEPREEGDRFKRRPPWPDSRQTGAGERE